MMNVYVFLAKDQITAYYSSQKNLHKLLYVGSALIFQLF